MPKLRHLASRGFLAFLASLFVIVAATPAVPARTPAGSPQPELRLEPLTIVTSRGPVRFTVEIADTEPTRQKGMMFRRSMAPDRGMLFHFQETREAAFWMRNTLIPLDIIFISPSGRVISIARNAVPLSEAPIPSGGVVRGVLELRGGRAAEVGILPGDVVQHRIFRR